MLEDLEGVETKRGPKPLKTLGRAGKMPLGYRGAEPLSRERPALPD